MLVQRIHKTIETDFNFLVYPGVTEILDQLVWMHL